MLVKTDTVSLRLTLMNPQTFVMRWKVSLSIDHAPSFSSTCLNEEKSEIFSESNKCSKSTKVKYKILESWVEYDSVANALARAGVVMTDDDDWSLLLVGPHISNEEFKRIPKNRKWNHFPGWAHLGRKDLLWKAMLEKISQFKDDYNIIPKSWLMPNDYKEFIKEKEVGLVWWLLGFWRSKCTLDLKTYRLFMRKR